MAINIRCQKCKADLKLTAKKCKCGAAISKKNRQYRVIVRQDGKRIIRTVSNLELAREIEGKLKVDIARGENKLQRKKAPILDDVFTKFLKWAKENLKGWSVEEGRYNKHIKPKFGKMRLDQLSPFDIEKLMVSMKKSNSLHGRPYSPTTIKHVVVLLSKLYNRAAQWGIYTGSNPCKSVRLPKLNNQITEYLSDQELKRLLDTLDTWPNRMSASFVLFLLYTGLRRGELYNLTWNDVDLDKGAILLRDPKGKKDENLPLSPKAVSVLENIPREYDTPWIFYGKNGEQRRDFRGPWYRIRKEAHLPDDFRMHGLRHHFASSLVSAGVDLYTVSKLLTHKDTATTQRYAHLADKALREAVELSDKLNEPKQASKVINLKGQNNG